MTAMSRLTRWRSSCLPARFSLLGGAISPSCWVHAPPQLSVGFCHAAAGNRHAVSGCSPAADPAAREGPAAGLSHEVSAEASPSAWAHGAGPRSSRARLITGGQAGARVRLPEKSPLPTEVACPGREAPTGALEAEVTYRASSQILLLGEADFSFAAALGRRFGDCSGLTATALESRDVLLARFGTPFARREAELEDRLCGILYSLPAEELPRRFRPGSFDCVIFNFPLPGTKAGGGDVSGISDAQKRARAAHALRAKQMYAELRELLIQFFRGAAHVLRPGGECHLRLTDQHASCRGLTAAEGFGLTLEGRKDFYEAFERVYRPLGYRPTSVTAEGRKGRGIFDVQHSSTLIFHRSRETMLRRPGVIMPRR